MADAVLERFGGISPEEKREAERAAYKDGWWMSKSSSALGSATAMEDTRDIRFPSLTPEPPTVTLSKGVYRRVDARGWQFKTRHGEWQHVSYPLCGNAEDFEKCRDLLRAEEGKTHG